MWSTGEDPLEGLRDEAPEAGGLFCAVKMQIGVNFGLKFVTQGLWGGSLPVGSRSVAR